jgi:hypothetical protein
VPTTGSDPKGNAACPTLPQFTVHCMLRRVLRTAHKDDLEIGNSDDVSNTTPEPKNDLKGLLP